MLFDEKDVDFLDTPYPSIWLCVIFVLIFINVFFALAETSLNESHKSRLERLLDDDDQELAGGAKKALKLLEHPERANAVIQLGITFVSILIGVSTSVILAPMVKQYIYLMPYADELALGMSILIVTYLTLMLSEFLPTRIAMQKPEATLIHCEKTLSKLIFVTKPIVSLLANSVRLLLALLGLNLKIDDTVTEDEVKDLIEQAPEDGTFEKKEQSLVDRVFHMSDQTAYSLMTPRTQMMWIDLEDTLEQNLAIIRATSEAIIPVGKESLDDFCGVIYIKDIFNAALDNKPLDLSQFIRKPMFIPRSMESFRVLEQFQETGIHEAAVLDEYGGVIGFITLQDILLELIGDTNNINEPEPVQITARDDNSWNIEGLCSIDDFKEKFDIDELPDEDQDHYQTMGGFVTALFGYIPKKGETVRWENFAFEIARLDRYRIDKIICTVEDKKQDNDGEEKD